MKTGIAGISLIRASEGCRLDAYQDSGGIWTIGFGSTANVYDGMRITFDEAIQRLQQHLEPMEREIARLVKVPLTQNQFDSIASLCFNIGVGNFEKSLLLHCLNCHQWNDAAGEFLKWDHCNGKVLAGLTKRRQAERELFLKA